GAQPDIPFCAFHGNAAVAGVDIYVATDFLGAYGPISRVDFHLAVQGLRGHRSIAGIHLEVRILRHMDLDAYLAVVIPPGEAPMAADSSVYLNGVALLTGVHVEIPVDLVAVVEDAEVDLFGVAGEDLDRSVVGVNANLSAAGDGVRLG